MTSDPPHEVRRSFIVCPSCGMLTPGDVVECVECGEPIAALVAAVAEQRSEQRFAESLFGRSAVATWVIIGINLLVFALMVYAAGTPEPGTFNYTETLINFGAKLNPAVDAGEYWRLVTPMFLHIGLVHLFVNMYSLYVLGPQVERLYGTSRYVVIYVLAGIGGVLGSYLVDKILLTGGGVSAGASGALFGLMGVLIVFGFRYRSELPGVFKEAFSPRVFLPVLVLNLVITFAIPFIDKGAHIGGLIAGGLLGAAVPYARPGERRAGFVWRTAATLAAAAVVASFAFAYRSADPIPDVNRFIAIYNSSDKTLGVASDALQTAADRSAVSADTTQSIATAAAQLDVTSGLDERSRELLRERKVLLERATLLLGERRSDLDQEQAGAFTSDVIRHQESWDAWLDQSGPRFGLEKKSADNNSSGGNDGN